MGKAATVVRMSSKGQVVIPAAFRRRMGLKTGQTLAVSTGPRDEILLLPVEPAAGARDLEEMRRRLRAAGRKQGGNPLAELEERRRQERLSGRLEHGQRGH